MNPLVPNTLKGFGVTLGMWETMFPPWAPFFAPCGREAFLGSRRTEPGSAGELLALWRSIRRSVA
jgi:hypothetical protein